MNGGTFDYLGGSSSRTVGGQQETVIDVTLPETGEYGVRANSHGRSTGRYTLTVFSSLGSGGTVTPARTTGSLAVGSRVNGSLRWGRRAELAGRLHSACEWDVHDLRAVAVRQPDRVVHALGAIARAA